MNRARTYYDSPEFTSLIIRGGALVAILILALVGFLVWFVFVTTKPPIAFTHPEYDTISDSILCPGDSLIYQTQALVYHSPIAPTTVRTWWDVKSDSQVASDGPTMIDIYVGKPVFSVTMQVSTTVPSLSPGAYEQRGAIRLGQLYATAYQVKFTVPDNCPEAGQ